MRAWVSILGSRSSRNWACRSTVALAKSPVAAIMGTTSEKRPPPRGGGRVTSSTAPAPRRGMDRIGQQHLGRHRKLSRKAADPAGPFTGYQRGLGELTGFRHLL